VNLSLSEGKQWSDLRTICPCHLCLSTSRSSLLVASCPSAPFWTVPSPPAPAFPTPPHPSHAGKFVGDRTLRRRRGIAASHLSRGPGPAESSPICKRVADGHRHRCRCPPPGPLPRPPPAAWFISTIHRRDGYLACRPHFSGPSGLSVSPAAFAFHPEGATPGRVESRAPSRHSNYEFDTDAHRRVPVLSGTRVSSSRFLGECICQPMPARC